MAFNAVKRDRVRMHRERKLLAAGRTFQDSVVFMDRCNAVSRDDLMRMMRNNTFLLRQTGKSTRQQVRELMQMGFSTNQATFSRLKSGHFVHVRLSFLQAFAIYWGVPVWELMGRDMEAEGRALAAAGQ